MSAPADDAPRRWPRLTAPLGRRGLIVGVVVLVVLAVLGGTALLRSGGRTAVGVADALAPLAGFPQATTARLTIGGSHHGAVSYAAIVDAGHRGLADAVRTCRGRLGGSDGRGAPSGGARRARIACGRDRARRLGAAADGDPGTVRGRAPRGADLDDRGARRDRRSGRVPGGRVGPVADRAALSPPPRRPGRAPGSPPARRPAFRRAARRPSTADAHDPAGEPGRPASDRASERRIPRGLGRIGLDRYHPVWPSVRGGEPPRRSVPR